MEKISVRLSSATDPNRMKYNIYQRVDMLPIYLPLHKYAFTAHSQKNTSRNKVVAIQKQGNGSNFQSSGICNLNRLVTKANTICLCCRVRNSRETKYLSANKRSSATR